jgi:photosystem II stability/assembly factor-like uncharacterized protein
VFLSPRAWASGSVEFCKYLWQAARRLANRRYSAANATVGRFADRHWTFHICARYLIFKVLPLSAMRINPRLVLLIFCFAVAGWGQWTPIGPDGGSAHVLAIDPRNPRHLLAGSRGLLVYQSEDAGESWNSLPDFSGPDELYQTALNVVAIDPADARTFYAGISATNARQAADNGAGLYKSTDAGQRWVRVPSLIGVSVYCLAIWEKDRHLMVAGTNHGVYRSNDSGESWEHISPEANYELQGVMSIAIDPRNAKVIYAGTPHLPWKTSDAGRTWHNIHEGMSDDSDVFSIRIDQSNSQRVYASACSGIYGSATAGASWTKFAGIPFDNRRTHVIAQDPKHSSTLYAATTTGLWRSTNSGAIWHKTMKDSINALVLDPDGIMYLAMDQRGILKSEDGGDTFREINRGYVNRTITTMQTAGGYERPYLYASTIYDGQAGGLFRREDAPAKWDLLASEELLHGRNLTSFAALGGSGHLVAASYDGFLQSSDEGRTWTDMASRKTPDAVTKGAPSKAGPTKAGSKSKGPVPVRPAVTRTVAGPLEPLSFPSPKIRINGLKASTGKQSYLIAATSAGLFSSTTGVDWQPLKIVPKINLSVSAVFVSPGDTGGLAAVTPAGLFLSHDRGATWLSTALPYQPDMIYEVAFDFQDPNLVLAASSDGIYQSMDGGKNWVFRYGGMDKGAVTSVIFHPLRHAEAYALHFGYVYKSTDGGAHWSLFDRSGLGNVAFRTIAFDLSDSDPQLYGLALLRGVYAYHGPSLDTRQTVTPHPHSASN